MVAQGQDVHDFARRLGFERSNRLIRQHHFGALPDGAYYRDALLLTTGRGGSTLCSVFSNSHPAQCFDATRSLLGCKPANQAAPHRYLVQHVGQHIDDHGQAAHQVELLKKNRHRSVPT